MAFTRYSAPVRERADAVLSADNAGPSRNLLLEQLRPAARSLGLKPPVLATLEVLLSFLPPQRNHHMVFASNESLMLRRSGLSDRSLRRHIQVLEDAGLLVRQDSPNGKRFARYDSSTGMALRFGFDLSPLFERFAEICARAAEARHAASHLACLKLKLRTLINRVLARLPEDAGALDAQKLLRRVTDAETLEATIDRLSVRAPAPAESPADPSQMASSDGHFVRHQHKAEKELNDSNADEPQTTSDDAEYGEALNIPALLETCPDATGLMTEPVRSERDVLRHGRFLAPMLGIDQRNYAAAELSVGPLKAALTVWLMLPRLQSIRNAGAWFRTVTQGAADKRFDPIRVLNRRITTAV